MKVAFIDDLINTNYLNEWKNPFVEIKGIYKVINNSVIETASLKSDLSHSTLCAKIFIDNIKTMCELSFLSVIDNKTLRGTVNALVIALEWCHSNSIEVINLSLGTTIVKEAALIKNAIDKISSKKTIIIAATSNTGLITYPAFFKNVIAVGAIKKKANYFADINCKVKEEYIKYNNLCTKISKQNSFAAPQVTAMVCNLVGNGISLSKINTQLDIQFKYKKLILSHGFKNLKPQIMLLSNDEEKAVKNIESILIRFSENNYEGVCITDCLCTDYTKPIINIDDLNRFNVKTAIKLINIYMDIDFVILYFKRKQLQKINKEIDIVVSDYPELSHKRRQICISLLEQVITDEEINKMLEMLT